MFTCAALAFALSSAALDAVPMYALEVERDANEIVGLLQADSIQDAPLSAALVDFSGDALALSHALRETGVTADMPCIFKGIGEDAAARAQTLPAEEGLARRMAIAELNALMRDALLLAPMAHAEAAKAAAR
jgi:hypothetical protein